MKATILSAAVLFSLVGVTAVPAGVIPPANGYKSNLTKPTAVTGTDWSLTKSSQVQVRTSSGNVTFQLKAGGVIDTASSTPVSQTANTFRINMRVNGVNRTKEFFFDLTNGKTTNSQTKYQVALTDTATWGVVLSPGDSVEVTSISLIQGGTGGGAGSAFAVAGITVK